MAEISSHGRGKKIPPKVPAKTINSAAHTTEEQTTSRQENVGSTTVNSNGRPSAQPRSFSKSVGPLQRSAEQKVGVLLPCFGEYKAQNAFNQRSRSADNDSEDKVLYRVPIRTDKPKLPSTRVTTGTYQRLPPPLVTGNPPRKPAILPNVNLNKFSVASKSGYFCLKNTDLSESHTEDHMSTQYDEAIYEVPVN